MREIEFWKFFFLERGKVRQTASYEFRKRMLKTTDISEDLLESVIVSITNSVTKDWPGSKLF